jgi:SAM-dependent methyltransferase
VSRRGDRFAFGENWQSFLKTVTAASIAEAERGLLRLLPAELIKGRRFLDIGCGSGLSMLAAARLGAGAVHGIDVDAHSVAAARRLLSENLTGGWSVERKDVFDLSPERDGRYDIVYSWGVLHHTGDMWRAIERAAAMVAPGGWLVVALYRRTPLCRLWSFEKRFYARAPAPVQSALRRAFAGIYVAALMASGRNPRRYIAQYKTARGMDWRHDLHDWLGGYPYESAAPPEVTARLERLGFTLERVFEHAAASFGLFGSHCDEFVARRRASSESP